MNGKDTDFFESTFWSIFLRGLISSIVSLAFFFLIWGLSKRSYQDVSNASFACFALLIVVSFFSLGYSKGYFDSYVYGLSFFFGPVGRGIRIKYGNTYSNYKHSKELSREGKSFNAFYSLTYFIEALIFLIFAIVYLILFNNSIN